MGQVRRQQALIDGENRQETLTLVGDAVDALRRADAILWKEACGLGWIGAGVLSYRALDDNIMLEGASCSLSDVLCIKSNRIFSSTIDE